MADHWWSRKNDEAIAPELEAQHNEPKEYSEGGWEIVQNTPACQQSTADQVQAMQDWLKANKK